MSANETDRPSPLTAPVWTERGKVLVEWAFEQYAIGVQDPNRFELLVATLFALEAYGRGEARASGIVGLECSRGRRHAVAASAGVRGPHPLGEVLCALRSLDAMKNGASPRPAEVKPSI
jgi:hypothetical protein